MRLIATALLLPLAAARPVRPAPFEKSGKWGYKFGRKVVIEPRLTLAQEFSPEGSMIRSRNPETIFARPVLCSTGSLRTPSLRSASRRYSDSLGELESTLGDNLNLAILRDRVLAIPDGVPWTWW